MAADVAYNMIVAAEWGIGIKIALIAIVSATLVAVAVLLVLEAVGKRSAAPQSVRTVVREKESVPQAIPAADDEPAPAVEETEEISAHAESVELTEGALLVDDRDDGDRGTMIVDGVFVKVRYNRSFRAKLIQSDDTLKGWYSELRNELLRYGLKRRASWANESWYNGRTTYAKFAIRGKTLSFYLALDPQKYKNTKYTFRDAGKTARYKDVPMQCKCKSARSVRWVKELLAALAAERKRKRAELPEENFRPDYRDTASLVRDTYIKLYYVADTKVSKQQFDEAAAADLKTRDKTPRDFLTKLMRADGETKAHYSAIKNELLRYGMKSRVSTGNESWYNGRTTYAKFAIRGKTLSLYLALDPKEFEGTKYNFSNMSDVGKYETVPMRMKLKSDRSVRWVKELLATLAEKKGWQRTERREEDFRYVERKH